MTELSPTDLPFPCAEVSIAASAFGDPSHPPVLLVHGGGQTRHSWSGTARALADRGWYAVAYDQRGHGESGRPADKDYRAVRFAEDLVEVATQVRLLTGTTPVVVGASLGGLSGLLAEGELDPGCTAGLVLVDITPRMERSGVDRIVGFMVDKLEEGFGSLDEAADAVAAYQPHRPRPKDHSGLRKNLRLDDDGRWRWHWDPDLFMGPSPLGTGSVQQRYDDATAALQVPTLLVRGKMSDLVSPEMVDHFLSLRPDAEYVDVSGAGHMVAGDRNDAFTEAVASFLDGLAARR